MNTQTKTLKDKLRTWPWLVAALITTTVVALIAPHQVGVLIWSLTKLCWGAYLGYWIDRGVFPYARPHDEPGYLPQLRRALIIAAVEIALGVGV